MLSESSVEVVLVNCVVGIAGAIFVLKRQRDE